MNDIYLGTIGFKCRNDELDWDYCICRILTVYLYQFSCSQCISHVVQRALDCLVAILGVVGRSARLCKHKPLRWLNAAPNSYSSRQCNHQNARKLPPFLRIEFPHSNVIILGKWNIKISHWKAAALARGTPKISKSDVPLVKATARPLY